ncbi:sugar transferase, partial [Senegalimassilia sp.]
MASDFTAVCEPAKARSDVWDSPSTEASRVTASSGALERKTVRSGFAYDINGGRGSAESSERARRLKEELGSVPVTGIEDRVAYRFVKRAFDIVFSAAVLVVFCWLFAIIAILIKVDDPKGPVFFSQERVGKDGRTFRMLKFRSMCVDAEDKLAELRELNEKTGPVFKIAEDPRITRVGKWLRKLSLDELPQFINVLRSDMSIVGPRPALPAEVATYNDYQRQRLLVKPGLTCYWQTRRNRDSITFDEWVDLDLLYIKKCSAWSDLKLIIQ